MYFLHSCWVNVGNPENPAFKTPKAAVLFASAAFGSE